MAGGTSLVLRLADGRARAGHVVALRKVAALRGIDRDAEGALVLRALTTHREAETSALVRAHCAALADAFGSIATVRIREQATVGGNLAYPDPAHDAPPMLIALGAEAVLYGPRGERRVPVEGFHDGEGALRAGELLTRIVVPPLDPYGRAVFVKYLPDTRYGYATVSIGAVIAQDAERRCVSARIAIGGCGPTALRLHDAERALIGRRLDAETIADAASRAAAATRPLDDVRGSSAY